MIKNNNTKKEKIKFLKKKRGSKFIFPAQIKHNLTMNLLEDCFTHDMVLVSPSMMKKQEKELLELKKEQEKEKEKDNTIDNNKKIIKSKSLPDILDETIKNEDFQKKRYNNVLYSNNKKHLDRLKKIIKTQSYSPGPNSYDTRGNLLNLNKGKTIVGKREYSFNNKNDVPFTNFKSTFDIIMEKQNNIRRPFNERFPLVTKEPILKEQYNDEQKWKKWEINKNKTKNIKFELFKKEREDFLNKHKELSKKIKEKKNEKIKKKNKRKMKIKRK